VNNLVCRLGKAASPSLSISLGFSQTLSKTEREETKGICGDEGSRVRGWGKITALSRRWDRGKGGNTSMVKRNRRGV
jgi:hypothetical protein